MYYIVLFAIYSLVLLAFIPALKKPGNINSVKARKRLAREMLKGLSKWDVKNRKKRVKVLPLSYRVLYLSWYITNISLFIVVPILLIAFRSYVMEALYAPETTIYFLHMSEDSVSLYVLFFFGIFLGMVLSMGFSYLTYTKTIERADAIYQTGSFQTYPKKFILWLAFITIVIVLPIAIMCFNSYRLLTENEIIIKRAYSFSARVYPYSEIDFVEQRRHSIPRGNLESFSYVFYTKDGEMLPSIDIGGRHRALAILLETISENDIEIHENG